MRNLYRHMSLNHSMKWHIFLSSGWPLRQTSLSQHADMGKSNYINTLHYGLYWSVHLFNYTAVGVRAKPNNCIPWKTMDATIYPCHILTHDCSKDEHINHILYFPYYNSSTIPGDAPRCGLLEQIFLAQKSDFFKYLVMFIDGRIYGIRRAYRETDLCLGYCSDLLVYVST